MKVYSGKRKRAIAKASIKEGTGKVMINKIQISHLDYMHKMMIEEPLRIAEKFNKINFDITVNVKGGGRESQIEAARLAIARALAGEMKSEALKKAFLAYDRNMLIADVRRKEPYKPGDSKARAKRQKSYR